MARALVDTLPTALLIVAANGRAIHANPAARATLPRFVAGAHYASLIRAPAFVESVAATLADRVERRFPFTAHPGRERTFEARVAALPPDGAFGPEATVLVQIEDRTEARRAEALRSDFVANASHELRTPLASIVGYIETLQNHARDDPEARERFLEIMGREAARMQRLVDDLMSLSRIEMSEHQRPDDDCVLDEVAAEAASVLQPLAEAQGVRLEIALPGGAGAGAGAGRGARGGAAVVPGDRDQLQQVFTNLIDNAIKYAGPGATVRVCRAAASRAFPNREGVTVSDTGPGIPREHLPRLTERFYRVNAGQSRTKGGTGLGLAIVKHILNRHEGKLEVVSAVGRGSAFTVWLPRREGGPAAEAGPAPGAEGAEAGPGAGPGAAAAANPRLRSSA
jgi:two-component system, OmpR family, phosphate regulon sensor histidine kinase PhoR